MKLSFMDIIGIGHLVVAVPLGIIYNDGMVIFTGIFFGILWIGVGKIQNHTEKEYLERQKKKSLDGYLEDDKK